jgi:nicotinamidase-related amidase
MNHYAINGFAEGVTVGSGSVWRYLTRTGRRPTWSSTRRRPTPLVAARADTDRADQAPVSVGMSTPADLMDLDPHQCALLVLGCQPGILDELTDPEPLILKTNAVIDIVRRHGGHISFVRLAIDTLDYQFIPTTNKEFSALARQGRFQKGTPEADIHRALAVQPADLVFRSTRLGAFSTTDLDEQLTNLGVTTLIIAGAHTSGVVLSTVREAADRDYRLILLTDCCADRDVSTHELLMARIFPRQVEMTTVTDMYKSLATNTAEQQRNSIAGGTAQV